ncbi:SAM-dependent methyltransferase [Solitalea sp. MAHUQ-68]|uniref:SAM-dependent methyltransferase n=1 Tax=Solitalea agri TaxID=2953739 RepID=A0A9X2F1Z3_9SPHI|nr:SAM-dependent methyltransferase [Solitalea agri]MCO4292710.1 SAM-dependent methyltransferase [Solitalea agri]
MPKGTLFLIPCSLGENVIERSIVPALKETIVRLDEFIVENEKSARKFLKEVGITKPQSELVMHDYGKHSRDGDQTRFLKALDEGKDVGLLSEAGCPAIADPGSDIVALAHQKGIKVVPFVGPSSLLLALMGSGFNGQGFAFHGYLPIDKAERSRKLKDIESISQRLKQTQLFIETPFRNNQLLEDLIRTCQPATELCIACDLTLDSEFLKTKTIAQWKIEKPDLHKRPAVFVLYKR